MAATVQSKPRSSPTSLRRSLSDPHLTRNRRRRPRCSFSSTSSKSSWSSKLAKLLARLALFSRDSDLTEENLEAHNMRIRDIDLDEKIHKLSPYYKGLTDSSLAIVPRSSLKLNTPAHGHGGHRHYAHSAAPTNASFSSIISKFKEWNPCIGNKNKNLDKKKQTKPAPEMKIAIKASVSAPPSPEKKEPPNALAPPSASSAMSPSQPMPKTTKTRNMEESFPVKEREKEEDVGWTKEREEKLLRERSYSRRGGGGDGKGTSAVAVGEEVAEGNGGKIRGLDMVEKEKFMWGDKYRPKLLDGFICNRSKAQQLKQQVRERRFGHYIFEGPPGVGKRTMIHAMLREAFGHEELEIKEVIKVFKMKSEMVGSIEVRLKEAPHYIEVNLSQTNGYEKQVIVQLIKETHFPSPCSSATCRGIIICESDKLSNETLMYVKWIIEKYEGCNKIFFCCSDVSKLQPLISLCTFVQLLPPSNKEIVEVLEFISKQQGFDLSSRLAERIAVNSKNNLRQAIRSLEASWHKSNSFEEDGDQLLTGWEDDIADVAKKMVDEQSPKQLYFVRGKLKKLIEHDVSPHFIFRTLVDELKKLVDGDLQHRIEGLYFDYSNKNEEKGLMSEKRSGGEESQEEMGKTLHDPMRKNFHHFLKIEEFVAKFMSCYKGEANKKNELPTRSNNSILK